MIPAERGQTFGFWFYALLSRLDHARIDVAKGRKRKTPTKTSSDLGTDELR